jgi:nanoRNase/pAp phosphatase (c-di-AMP/oligoRNAs hydrolase)
MLNQQNKKKKDQQIFSLVEDASSVLVCLPEKPSTDAIASGLGLLAALQHLGKRARVVSTGFRLPANHTFLPKSEEIFDDIPSLRQFVISLDVSKTSVEELSYDVQDNTLNIMISPKDGFFSEKDVSASGGDYAYDLIMTVDAQSLDDIGRVHDNNAEFFHDTPIINIDHSPANTNFGQVDLLNVTATSTSEMVFELIKEWKEGLLDEYIATNLLTGMISKTKSFQSGAITPRSMAIASHLIEQGARRDEIVQHLFQSKKISTLKLWGRTLSKLESDNEHKIVWSMLTPEDFSEAGAAQKDLPDVIDELIINTPDAKNVFILYTMKDGTVKGYISTAAFIPAMDTFTDWDPKGDDDFIYIERTDTTIEKVRDEILKRLRTHKA